jgi:GTP-binding protein LepA
MSKENIRNFCIIAHIDHGKSTLADRFLEITGTVEKRHMRAQYLDQLESERERGITIKMAPVRMIYHAEILNPKSEILNKFKIQNSKSQNSLEFRDSDLEFANSKQKFVLNLIDTPGHNDFKYEVSRALAAVEGAILLVDASQGIQAQTLANFESAKQANLKIIGVVNKIDLNPPQLEEVVDDLSELLQIKREEIIRVSGKTGSGVEELLNKVIEKVPPPLVASNLMSQDVKLGRALIFDSLYDDHKGVIAFVRVFDGEFGENSEIKFIATGATAKIKEAGYFFPQLKSCEKLNDGEIGYLVTGLKNPDLIKIGDTIVSNFEFRISNFEKSALAGFIEPQPVVFVSFYPEASDDYENLKKALAKLRLTDSSLKFEPDASEVLGRGFKGGFLGRLHFEIAAERLEKEFKVRTVHSFPSVAYKVKVSTQSDYLRITNPKDFPIDNLEVLEPITKVEILTPIKYLGEILSLKEFFRFNNIETNNLGNKIIVSAKLPLADLISDLDDKLKSVTQGYASLNYEIVGYEKWDLQKLEILVADQIVPGLTRILPKEKIQREGRLTVERLRDLLPRQQFAQAVQASVRGKIIARETIPALRKDVTGYLYGGDRTRKQKLWKKQQAGKAKLKARAQKGETQVKIPASIFKELLKK